MARATLGLCRSSPELTGGFDGASRDDLPVTVDQLLWMLVTPTRVDQARIAGSDASRRQRVGQSHGQRLAVIVTDSGENSSERLARSRLALAAGAKQAWLDPLATAYRVLATPYRLGSPRHLQSALGGSDGGSR